MRLAIAVVLLVILYASPAVSAENNSNETIITVDSTNLRFSPSTVTINEGDTIRFFWDGQFLPHNAVEENETFDSGDTASDEDYPFVFVFGLNGTFDYHCEPHRSLGMVGHYLRLKIIQLRMTSLLKWKTKMKHSCHFLQCHLSLQQSHWLHC